MKLLVACPLPEPALDELRSPGVELVYLPRLAADELAARMRGVAVLVVDRKRVSPEAIAAGDALQLIVRDGTTTSNIALEDAADRGVFVCNCPYRDAAAIAELTLGLLVALDRGLISQAASGEARPQAEPTARGLAGCTIGLLGFHPIAAQVARRALAFDMRVLAWSAGPAPLTRVSGDVEFCEFPREMARKCDFLSVYGHSDGRGDRLVDADLVQSLPDGAGVVHVGHPAVLDEDALVEALRARRIRLAADLSETESEGESVRLRARLADLPGTLVTQRLAAATLQARAAVATEIVRIVRQFLVNGEALNCVNLLERSPATWQLLLRLRDAPGVMAAIMDCIRTDGVNAEEIGTRVFIGARAAWCTIALDDRPSAEALEAIRALPGVMHVDLRAVV